MNGCFVVGQYGRPGCGERAKGIQRRLESDRCDLDQGRTAMRAAAPLCRCGRSRASPSCSSGTGEKPEALELFQPERNRLAHLGNGRCACLGRTSSRAGRFRTRLKSSPRKIAKGKSFDLADLRDQLGQLQNMGGMAALLDKLPAHLQANAGAASARQCPEPEDVKWASSIR